MRRQKFFVFKSANREFGWAVYHVGGDLTYRPTWRAAMDYAHAMANVREEI